MVATPALAVALVLCCCAGCKSVVNPFGQMRPDYRELPVDAMRALALEIETAVQAGDRDAQIADREGLVLN